MARQRPTLALGLAAMLLLAGGALAQDPRFSLDFRPAKRLEGWINAPNKQGLSPQKSIDDNERQVYSGNDRSQDRER